jgi:hypothetical protein
MPWISNLTVRYHQQNDRAFCGPTTAMMMIDSLHGPHLDEEMWWKKVQSGLSGWSTDPASLEAGLNTVAPTALNKRFVVAFASREPNGTRTLVEALCPPNAGPAAALVHYKSHWVAVCNVNLAAAPVAGVAPVLLGFYINSPTLTPLHLPQSHTNTDRCGTTASLGSTEANQYVAYAAWKSDWFNGYQDTGKTVFATVCLKKNPQFPPLPPAPQAPPPGRGEAPEAARVLGTSEVRKMIPPADAKSAALTGIAEHGLAKEGPLAKALHDVSAGDPELVHRLDAGELPYYLVPLVRAEHIVGLARTDAVHGDFMGACAVGGDGTYHVVTACEIEREMPGYRLVDTVWMPCRESTSPFNPFHLIAGPRGERYVDRNGNAYSSLTPLGAGE